MVVKMWVSSPLKICTMCRSESESMILKTYVPAGRTCAPTPGTSTGPLNVILVLLFVSSADALGSTNTQTVNMQTMIKLLVKDRKSTRLNSSHLVISYAVFCLKKKNQKEIAGIQSSTSRQNLK